MSIEQAKDRLVPQPHQHTPGPWSISRKNALSIKSADGGLVAKTNYTTSTAPYRVTASLAEAEANARLIAAAPDMLMALEMVLPALVWCEKQWANSPQKGDGVNVLTFARAAIAKATT